MTAQPKQYNQIVDHEVRIRILEDSLERIENKIDTNHKEIRGDFKEVYKEMRSNFIYVVGILLASNSFLPMILHHFHLI